MTTERGRQQCDVGGEAADSAGQRENLDADEEGLVMTPFAAWISPLPAEPPPWCAPTLPGQWEGRGRAWAATHFIGAETLTCPGPGPYRHTR
ncbi:hypothetical protein Scani_77110 [Streptomyces caniferus]|uniref:Uncharacterized protein n=1 Tax=Streptomyces caniferus TaxID=285557 RepID=A0A640SIP9_9ACTN|nr:hypothetical protein Scani_77110 [Streptomyces caniferus]